MPDLTTGAGALALTALLAYLLGSVPFGIVVTRAFGLGDLRAIGSGNIGATNVLRTGNKVAAFLTFFLDAAKGGIAVLIARAALAEDAGQVAGAAAFLGHLYPVFLRFKGGKGVSTFFGTLFALAWPVGLVAGAIWLAVAFALRYSSLAGLSAAALTPVLAAVLGAPGITVLRIFLAALIFARHDANIRRLIAGTEPKIGRK